MALLWALNVLSSRIFRLPPYSQSLVFFLHRPTCASTFSPLLSFTNMAASSDTTSCVAPVSLYVWVLPPCASATPLIAALLSLSVLMGGRVGFVTWAPSCTTDSLASRSRSLCWGVLVLIPGPPRGPPTCLSMSVLVGIRSIW